VLFRGKEGRGARGFRSIVDDMSELHVVFGTGPVGRAVIRELASSGHRVRAINRTGASDLPEGVEPRAGDAADRQFAREVCAEAAVVYQCAAPPYHRWPELFPRLQAGVIAAAAAAGAKLVVMENVYMYGSSYGKPLTERRPTTATTRKGRVRAEMAEALLNAHQKGRVRVAIGRASDFFGPEVLQSAMGARVFGAALRGEPANVLGDISLPHTYSYVPDIARGLVMLGRREEALGEVWHLPGPETATTREFLTMVYAEAGHPTKYRRAGKPMLRFLGFFNPQVRELVEMMYQFEEPFVVDHGKFADTFGDISTPLTDAIRATVEWYRSQGKADAETVKTVAADTGSQSEVAEGSPDVGTVDDQKSTE
jgi:nucleoside-diphosphate-sugar epimerase